MISEQQLAAFTEAAPSEEGWHVEEYLLKTYGLDLGGVDQVERQILCDFVRAGSATAIMRLIHRLVQAQNIIES